MNFFSARKQRELDELDAFITSQEFEPCHIEDNVFEDPNFWQSLGPLSGSKAANINSDEELLALALLLNVIKDFRKNEFIPNYEILLFILKNILIKQPALSHEDSCSEIGSENKFLSQFKPQNGDSKFVVSRLRVDFKMCERLGKGGCGVVVRAKSNIDSKEYAIKKINIYPHTNRDRMLREVRILSSLLHPNVVRYHGGWLDCVTEEEGADPESGENGSVDECEEGTRVTSGNEDTCETSKEDKTLVSSEVNLDGVGIFIPVLPINNPKIGLTIAVRSNSSASLNLLHRGNIVSTFIKIAITQSQLIARQKLKSHNEIIPTDSKSCFHSSDNLPISKQTPDHPKVSQVLCIQLELCEGSLKEWLVKRNARRNTFSELSDLDFEIANDFSSQLFKGLSYIHSKDIIHRDIKPSNLMLSEDFQVLKIGDFGLSKKTYDKSNIDSSNATWPNGPEHTIRMGTFPYSSPEQYSCNDYTNKTDIFSSALVMLELFSPFRDLDQRMVNLEGLREGYLQDDFQQYYPFESNLIVSMVNRDWDMRPSADRILELFSVRNGQNETYLDRTITMKDALLKLKDEKIAELKAKIENMQTK